MALLSSLLFNLIFYGGTSVLAFALLPLMLSRNGASWAGRIWGRYCNLCCQIIGLSYQLKGDMAADRQVIYAVKHQSAWETMVLYDVLGAPLVVLKKELLRLPVIGQFMQRAGVVAINRAAGVSSLRQMKSEAHKAVASQRSVLIFPQGTRVAAGAKAPYHSGIYMLYQHMGLPVIPVALNAGMFWGRAAWKKQRGMITVDFLPAIPPGLERREFMSQLESMIETRTSQLEDEVRQR